MPTFLQACMVSARLTFAFGNLSTLCLPCLLPTSDMLFCLRRMVIAVVGAAGHEPGSFHDRHAAQQGCHDDPDLAAVCTGVL